MGSEWVSGWENKGGFLSGGGGVGGGDKVMDVQCI